MSPITDNKIIYLEYINDLLDKGINLKDITSSNEFKNFRRNNLISFKDAVFVDMYFFGFSGS